MIRVLGTELNQWDVGRYINVTNSEADRVHLANKGDSRAVIMEIADAQVKIPDYLLQTGKQVCAYAVKDGVTVEREIFFVHHRERPENYIYEEDQRNFIYALIDTVEKSVARAEKAAEAIESGNIEKTMYTRDVFVGGAKDVYGSWGPRNPFIVDHTPLLSSIKNEMYISTMKIPKAGQHFLILPEGSNYLYKMQITESAQTRVFDVNEMQVTAAGTYPDNYYYEAENGIRVIFSAKTRVDISQKTFEDGFTGQKRLNFQKNTVFEGDNTDFPFPAVEFYVNGPAEVTIWWVAGESNRIFAIQSKNRSGPSRMEVSGTFVAHGSAETKGTHTAGHLNVKSEAKIGGTLTVDNDIKMAGSLDVGNDMKLAGGLKFTGSDSLDMGGNDIKNVQSLRMAGTLAVENDSKLRSIKPYKRVDETGVEQEVYNIGTDDAFYDRGCFKRLRLGKPVTDENGKIVAHEYTELDKWKLDTVLSSVILGDVSVSSVVDILPYKDAGWNHKQADDYLYDVMFCPDIPQYISYATKHTWEWHYEHETSENFRELNLTPIKGENFVAFIRGAGNPAGITIVFEDNTYAPWDSTDELTLFPKRGMYSHFDPEDNGCIAIRCLISPKTILDKVNDLDAKIDTKGVVIQSRTAGSTKRFKLTIDDSGTITATEVT